VVHCIGVTAPPRLLTARRCCQVVFCILSLSSNFLVFRPMIRALDGDIKATRSLLVLFPSDVVSGVKVLKDALVEFTKQLR
jgi:hypothetical protein